ncbi:MAG: aldehyde dehydrogenase family protein, partial [Chloroflexi bacterium]|nr:aldehyde dehydrogenase family protein [Chloroflexota bacterium]
MTEIYNYINNEWIKSSANEFVDIINPATQELLGRTPLSTLAELDKAVQAAAAAAKDWRNTPVTERVQYLFKIKNLLEDNFEDISRTITMECGKTLEEARGEMRRAIENVEIASGMPIL